MLVALLIAYSLGLVALGLWFGRQVRHSGDFFVAGRSLGPGLLFATLLAANIGAGSTVGATGLAYTDGWAAWWWNGSAGLGSLVLAFWVGPRMWREAEARGYLSVGDFFETHFGRDVRGLAALMIWLGSFVILCAQLRGAAEVLQRVAGLSIHVGAMVAALLVAAYFGASGLFGTARINTLQLIVKLSGFLLAAPFALSQAGGWPVLEAGTSFWRGTHVGWPTLLLLGPAFFLSPGLLQKTYGARDARTVRIGVAANGLALLAFAFIPVIIGLTARALHPGLERPEMALPAVLASDVPAFVGALALAAVFSAELSAADAVLFMLATSGARDFYRGYLRPAATDRQVLLVARVLALVGCVAGFLLTFVLESVRDSLLMFYSIMVAGLFAPTLGGLYMPQAGRWSALASMLVGVTIFLLTDILTGGAGYGWAAPSFLGMLASGLTYIVLGVF